jgi:hypothetical protein
MLHLPPTNIGQVERFALRLTLLILMLAELAEIVHKAVHHLICVPLGWK